MVRRHTTPSAMTPCKLVQGVCTICDLPDAGHWTFGLGLTSDIYEVILTGVGSSND